MSTTCLVVTNVIKCLRPVSRDGNIVNKNMRSRKRILLDKTINIADTRGGFDSKSTTTNIMRKEIEFLQIKTPGSRQKNVVK